MIDISINGESDGIDLVKAIKSRYDEFPFGDAVHA